MIDQYTHILCTVMPCGSLNRLGILPGRLFNLVGPEGYSSTRAPPLFVSYLLLTVFVSYLLLTLRRSAPWRA